jgi:DNA-binding NarL/FixJ family response regulator
MAATNGPDTPSPKDPKDGADEPYVQPVRQLRVVIADDHRLVLMGMRAALSSAPDIRVVGEARSGRGVVDVALRTRPDVVLVDLRMPDGDGLWALKELRERLPECRVIVCSMLHDHQHVSQAVQQGAAGYILKTIDPDSLASAIRQTVEGTVFSAHALYPRRSGVLDTPEGALSERELEVLQLVAEGLANAAIGRKLWVTEQTVKFHLSNIYRKLGVKNRTEASRHAVREGLIATDPLKSPEDQ